MRHQPHHVAALIEDASDVTRRAIRVFAIGIAKDDAVLVLEAIKRLVVRKIVAVAMRDRKYHPLSFVVIPRVDGLRLGYFERHWPANEFEIGVAHQCAWQEARFRQNLKSVADPENRATSLCVSFHCAHDMG